MQMYTNCSRKGMFYFVSGGIIYNKHSDTWRVVKRNEVVPDNAIVAYTNLVDKIKVYTSSFVSSNIARQQALVGTEGVFSNRTIPRKRTLARPDIFTASPSIKRAKRQSSSSHSQPLLNGVRKPPGVVNHEPILRQSYSPSMPVVSNTFQQQVGRYNNPPATFALYRRIDQTRSSHMSSGIIAVRHHTPHPTRHRK